MRRAVNSLTESAAITYDPERIRANAIAARTEMIDTWQQRSPGLVERLVAATPLRRQADPEEIAQAAAVFVEQGVSASTEEIARRAGLGIGTVFRHFPTKEALLKAVYEQRLDHLAARAQTAGTGDASPTWFREFFTEVASTSVEKLILADALGDLHLDADPAASARLRSSIGALLQRAQVAGTVRQDASFDHLIALMIAAGRAAQATPDEQTRKHLINVILDGLETHT